MTDDTKTITAEQARAWLEAALGACDAMADAGCRLSAPMVAGTLERFAHSLEAERQRADELEAALKASEARVGGARIMAGLILSAYDPAGPCPQSCAAAAIERAHRFLLDTKPAALSSEEGV